MNSDEELPSDEIDSGNESSGDDVEFPMDVESNTSREKQNEAEDYPFEVLSTEQIVQHMVDSIKEVNSVIQVCFSLLKSYYKHVPQSAEHAHPFVSVHGFSSNYPIYRCDFQSKLSFIYFENIMALFPYHTRVGVFVEIPTGDSYVFIPKT